MAEQNEDEKFESVESGASLTYPVSAGSLKKGDCVVIKGHPCKVIELTTSKTGKHGHAKANITALDIFTKQKLEEVSPTSHNLPAPFVKNVAYVLIDISEDGRVSLMDEEGETREDLSLPDDSELQKNIREQFEGGEKEVSVVVCAAMGKEQILSMKTATN